MNEVSTDGKKKIINAIILFILGLYLIFGSGLGVGKITLLDFLNQKAANHIDDALEKSLVVFTAVSGVKAAISMVEGSSVGVGFDLEIGDLVQPAYDYIDFVWKLFLFSTFLLTLYKLMIESGILLLGINLIGCGVLLIGVSYFWQSKKEKLLLFSRKCLLYGFLIGYLVPVTLLLAQSLSSSYIAPLKEKTSQEITESTKVFSDIKREFILLKNKVSILSPGESFDEIKLSLMKSINTITNSAWKTTGKFLYYVTILLMELLFLPFLLALIIYFFFQVGLQKIGGYSK